MQNGSQPVFRLFASGLHEALVPRAVAEVAHATGVERLDLPGTVRLEMHRTRGTIGGSDLRTGLRRTGKGVTVGLLDTEVWAGHRALRGRVFHRERLTAEPWGHPGLHGTGVAGIIAADDGGPNFGIAPECTIYNYKLFMARKRTLPDDVDVGDAMIRAVEDDVQLINCSLGLPAGTEAARRLVDVCEWAWKEGVAVVKSAGNYGPGYGTLTSPADAKGVIVVGATDRSGVRVQRYSSRGAHGRTGVHVVAPGGGSDDPLSVCRPRGGFRASSRTYGTSFAAPHVTGVLAHILEVEPGLQPDALRARLMSLCVPLMGEALEAQGAGLVCLDALA